jgi:hypothetical protein
MIKLLWQFLLCILFTSCASTLHKKCTKMDWSQFGIEIAKDFKDWKNDPFLASCKNEKVEPDVAKIQEGFNKKMAEQCTSDFFQTLGKNGDKPTIRFCPKAVQPQVSASFKKGLKVHCTKEGAYNRGLSGKENFNLCPVKSRKSFELLYQKGKSNFLSGSMLGSESRVLEIDNEIIVIDKNLSQLRVDYTKKLSEESREEGKKKSTAAAVLDLVDDSSQDLKTKIDEEQLRKEKLITEKKDLLLKMKDIKIQKLQTESKIILHSNSTEEGALEED